MWITDLTQPEEGFAAVQHGVDARCYASVAFDGRLYIWTDAEAPRGRLCVADPAAPQRWTTLVAEDPEAVLGDYAVLDEEILIARSRHAIGEVQAVSRQTGAPLRDIALPGIGSVLGITSAPAGGTSAWIGYTDALTPPSVLDAQGRSWVAAPGAVEVAGVTATVETATSADGTTVRIHLLAPAAQQGPLPTVLYGYGGFGISMEPAYTASALAWVEAGGVWAVAQLRGGGEEGEAWHRAGMRERKQNVFADFEAAARHLRDSGRASTLGCLGGSNGGLLVGAAITREPALYDAAVSSARAAGHGALRTLRAGFDLERRVRHGGRSDRAGLAARLLAAACRARGGRVPADPARGVRLRYPGGSAARPQVRRRAAMGGRSGVTPPAAVWCCCAASRTSGTAVARSTARSA